MYKNDFSYLTDEELETYRNRCTGSSTKLIDELVQEFFTQPVGTKIFVNDHYPTRQADICLGDRVAKRLEFEHHVPFKYNRHSAQGVYFVREEPTYHERIMAEIEKRERKNGNPQKKPTITRYKLKHR